MKLYKSLGEVDIDKEIVVTKHECYHIDCEENDENKRILVDFFEIYDNKLDMDINIDIRPISFNKTAWSSNVKSIFIKSGISLAELMCFQPSVNHMNSATAVMAGKRAAARSCAPHRTSS